MLEDFSKTMLFSVANVCCGCVCSAGSIGTSVVDCVLKDVSPTMLFSHAYCVWRPCGQWGF